jgi:hypothetical protein
MTLARTKKEEEKRINRILGRNMRKINTMLEWFCFKTGLTLG